MKETKTVLDAPGRQWYLYSMPVRHPFSYEVVEARIESLITGGALSPGDRVPSVREICRTHRVSVATAIQSLSNLEAKSLIRAKPRSGFYVQPINRLPLPAASLTQNRPQKLKVSEDVARVFEDIRFPGAVPLGAGVPDPELLPANELSRCVARAARLHAKGFGEYPRCETDLLLRKEIALRLGRTGCSVSVDELVITNGGMEALNLAVRSVASPGDTILVESPTYFGILQMIESLGMKAISVPSACDTGIDLAAFERAVTRYRVAAAILIPSFSNPHGASMGDDKRRALTEIAEKHRVPIIEDDIYGEIAFDGVRPKPLKGFGDSANTLLCASLSKCLSPSLRVGWVAGGRYTENVRRLKWITSIATPHVTTKAAADYLRSGGFDRHLRRFSKSLSANAARLSNGIASCFPDGTSLSRPKGGYSLWVGLPPGVNSLVLRDAAIKRGISICPGPIFSIDEEFQNCVRLNCAIVWGPRLHDAVRTLGELAHRIMAGSGDRATSQ